MGLSFLFGLKDLAEDLVDRVVNLQDDVCELLCELEDRICLVESRTSKSIDGVLPRVALCEVSIGSVSGECRCLLDIGSIT